MRFLYVILAAVLLSVMPFSNMHAYGDNSYGWGYEKRGNHKPPKTGFYGDLLNKYGGYHIDPSGEKVLYLTFDNGYEQGYTDDILDVLKEKEVPATFFVTGHYIKSAEELVQRMVNEGHIVGNHSWSHPDFSKMSKDRIKNELVKVEQSVANITDQDSMKYLRPPRGTFSERSLAISEELGYINMFWSLAFVDWHTKGQKGWKYAYDSVMKQVHPGAIMLLHTVSEDNAKALERIIEDLQKQGYTFKSLDDLVLKQMLPDPIAGFMN
ncbi:delta-lactam-biosynthetic de-N-acetylase [Pontibacillus marinus]|uniref:Polysaccharide deacetylase n=1 Tax=Pontibacillus marinus BH030004 = DSM 16465 TaxID=1385511 RepID=A0A0A5GGQ5_9BACI|nr:delta-lactam-biosynthetic de-N-acetylase [Pontibacillus marinus]KGX90300.1 polysaccharide deacetylase [Pontibacillus marinus BH030004 = DSM 16465]